MGSSHSNLNDYKRPPQSWFLACDPLHGELCPQPLDQRLVLKEKKFLIVQLQPPVLRSSCFLTCNQNPIENLQCFNHTASFCPLFNFRLLQHILFEIYIHKVPLAVKAPVLPPFCSTASLLIDVSASCSKNCSCNMEGR